MGSGNVSDMRSRSSPAFFRSAARRAAVDLEQIEAPRNAAVLLPADERAEVGPPFGIERDALSVQDAGLTRESSDGLRDIAKTGCEVFPVLRPDESAIAVLVELQAVAVEFDLVHPAFAGRRQGLRDGL